MIEVTLNDQQYRIGRLTAMQQFHVTRRIGPLLPKLIPALMGKDKLLAALAATPADAADADADADADAKIQDASAASAERDAAFASAISAATEAVTPFVNALADMPDEAAEYVIAACMGVVSRQQANGWRPVWSGGSSLFDDMDMGVIGPLVVRVITESLGPFLRGLFTGPTQD